MKRLVFIVPVALLIVLLLPRCAKIVAPTGGPKDTIAPLMVRSIPEPNAINFKGQKLSMFFNEYIQLKDLQKKLVLSPPQKQLPEIRIKGKGFGVVFAEELEPNLTYTLYFADAIADNNEGNKINSFEFAFSTGPFIDSLEFRGKVVDAFTLEPVEGMLIMLYNQITDSVPLLEKPLYVSKTSKQGTFVLSNLKAANYKIFGLTDGNSNYLFDQISESIAFTPDTVKPENLSVKGAHTVIIDSNAVHTIKPTRLKAFKEDNRVLRLTDFTRSSRHKISFIFSGPHPEPLTLKPLLDINDTIPWFVSERNTKNDSITFWITEPRLFNNDTLSFVAEYFKTDSLQLRVATTDTLRFVYTPRETGESRRSRRRNEDEPEKKPSLGYTLSPSKGTSLTPLEKIGIAFNVPLKDVDLDKIRIESLTDSSLVTNYNWENDTINPRRFSIAYPWEYKKGYSIIAFPHAFKGIDGLTNDTIKISFAGVAPEMFGTISLKVEAVTHPVIVELINDRGKTIDWQVANSDCMLIFRYIFPETYSFRFIVDLNQNGKWDTGYYLKGLQPEPVYYFMEGGSRKKINVRRNWEYEFSVNINDLNK